VRLRSKKKTLTPKQKKLNNFALGLTGESQAVEFLISNNYAILTTNYEFASCEVDIIAHDHQHDELVFIEVKTRSKGYFGSPSEAVNRRKLDKMARVAQHYLHSQHLQADYRFDIIAICGDEIEHFINVTWP
jgi:putative endonuclease